MIRRLILDSVALLGLALAIYGVWQVSEPWAFILAGLAVFGAAELIAVFPRKPRGL